MSPEEREDQDFEAFMDGHDEVSREYAKLDRPSSPQNLDDAVLRMSRAAVAAPRPPPVVAPAPRRTRRWQVPVALAATVVLSLSAIVTLHEDRSAREQALMGSPQGLSVPVEQDATPAAAAAPAPASRLDEMTVTGGAAPEPAAAPPMPGPMAKPEPQPPPVAMKPTPPPASMDAQMGGQLDQLRATEMAAKREQESGARKEEERSPMAVAPAPQDYAQRQPAASGSSVGSLSRRSDARAAASPAPAAAPAMSKSMAESRVAGNSAQPRARLDSDGDGVPDFENEADEAAYLAAQKPKEPPTLMEKTSLVGAEEWIALIRKLRDQPNLPEARRELENFRRTFPGYPLPEDLKPLLP